MQVEATSAPPGATGADTVAIGVLEGEGGAPSGAPAAVAELLESGEARRGLRKLAVTHADGRRWIVTGLGARAGLDAERARVAAAVALGRAEELGSRTLCWIVPSGGDPAALASGLVEGTVLAAYRFDRYRRAAAVDPPRLERLVVSSTAAAGDVAESVAEATILGRAANAARDLQNAPANDLVPAALAERAAELAGEVEGLSAASEDREQIAARGMGAFSAVARGSAQEPRLITLRYEPPGGATDGAPLLALVGKAITFDTGGISIKPAAKMHEMKFDMSGGAAVIEAIGAIARLRLPIRVLGVIGAAENMPDGGAVKPGDIVTALDGTTIEINNTDAEGRLVLADCLAYAIELGAERIVDIATLTGAILVALGSTYAGLIGTDDALCATVEEAGRRTGDLVWRLPLHAEYAELVDGSYADIQNMNESRKAGASVAAEFLKRFTGDVPWAHVDMAGVGWNAGRAYAPKGGSGYGVRLLVEVARTLSTG